MWEEWTLTQRLLLGIIGILAGFCLLRFVETHPPPERAMQPATDTTSFLVDTVPYAG